MVQSAQAFSGFSARDITAERQFFSEVLGLPVTEANGMLRVHLESGAEIFVYPKRDHEPAAYTVLNFPVEDIDSAVDELTAKGVEFLRYEPMAAATDERGIFRGGGPYIAWFTDPAGNVMSVLQERE